MNAIDVNKNIFVNLFIAPLPVSVTVMFMSTPRLGESKTITIDPGGIHFKGNKVWFGFINTMLFRFDAVNSVQDI